VSTLGTPVPILRSFDEARTRAFYLDLLGFEPVFEHRFAPDLPLYMGVCRDGCVLHLSEHDGDGSPGAAVRVPVADIDAFVAAVRARGNGTCRPGDPEQVPWGSREVTLTDPAGNRLTFYSDAR
jgi:catechol 2,3-dioxygenase-like lactoylglutathione lyase family enzyme